MNFNAFLIFLGLFIANVDTCGQRKLAPEYDVIILPTKIMQK